MSAPSFERPLDERRGEGVVDHHDRRSPRARPSARGRAPPRPRCRSASAAGWTATRSRPGASCRRDARRASPRGRATGRCSGRHDAHRPQHLLEEPVRAAVDVVADEHLVAGQRQGRDRRRGRRARWRRRARGLLPRGAPRPPRGGCASGCRCARTPSRRAASPTGVLGETCWSGRSAARRRRSARRDAGRRGRRACRASTPHGRACGRPRRRHDREVPGRSWPEHSGAASPPGLPAPVFLTGPAKRRRPRQ